MNVFHFFSYSVFQSSETNYVLQLPLQTCHYSNTLNGDLLSWKTSLSGGPETLRRWSHLGMDKNIGSALPCSVFAVIKETPLLLLESIVPCYLILITLPESEQFRLFSQLLGLRKLLWLGKVVKVYSYKNYYFCQLNQTVEDVQYNANSWVVHELKAKDDPSAA